MSETEGKGPGYAIIVGLVVLLFSGMIVWAGWAGAIHRLTAACVVLAIVACAAWLLATAQWAKSE